MPNYRRPQCAGATYFITQVTYQRIPWLCTPAGRKALREAILHVSIKHPFFIDAFVLLPEHFHCILTLPDNEDDFSMRLRLIKTYVTKHYKQEISVEQGVSISRQKRLESNLWQRRFWEHLIRDEQDFASHCDYIHYNPVKHGLSKSPRDWQFSTIHRFIHHGVYPSDWGENEEIVMKEGIGGE
ncbi:MAG: transposase [Limnospira sp. PMC 1291.21]|uniref:Transposase IS200-like domain-containing protein n=2 Tax=Limnospira TaxID=2596745 RepID=B5W2S3_LIMMA|nr:MULTISPECIES: transposase [Limnospira]EKD06609.1 hypothetical protein SPLC1_S532030 [Arthrospira platensis C1]QJB26517.1 transposase [Limnospira fusiformis SAG 85.79]RAQ47264.1 transposase [Arthrospira sp. O9.13F]EDZ94197.1 conserved hypothetical protein [Limnospira maxima CS-328]MDT9180866.1 transposase [Limnospira sp. PMC 1238.20]